MGCCGGTQVQQEADEDNLAQDPTELSADQPCKAFLQVTCVRTDLNEGIENITVKATGAENATKASVETTGLADFGAIEAGTYDIEIELSPDYAKKYQTPTAQKGVAISKGETRKLRFAFEPKVILTIVLIDEKDEAVQGAVWELTAPLQANGTTEEDGKISIADFPWNANDGALEITLPKQPAVEPVAAGGQAADYPPAIKPADFLDEAPKALDNKVQWTLAIADLEQGDNDQGVAARLQNLGFSAGDEKTERAVKAYQRLYMNVKEGSGTPADIKDDIKPRHDNP
jgi:hypothetical protein